MSWGDVWQKIALCAQAHAAHRLATLLGAAGSGAAGSRYVDEHFRERLERIVLKELYPLSKQLLGAWEFVDLSLRHGCVLLGDVLCDPERILCVLFLTGLHVFPTFVVYELTVLLVLTLSVVIMKVSVLPLSHS